MKSLILASASPRRLQLLEQIGIIPAKVIPADIDETPFDKEPPHIYAARTAKGKALKVLDEMGAGNFFILSADTVVAMGRRILGKAIVTEDAYRCLELLSGRTHRVITSVCMITPEAKVCQKTVTSKVKFKNLSKEDIEFYIKSLEWKGKAGGYAIQGLGSLFIKNLSGSYSGVVGLPLYETGCLLKGNGFWN